MKPTITDIISFIRANMHVLGITLHDKATDLAIKNFEKRKTPLPDDLKTFYQFSNGFDSDEDLFRIIPLEEMAINAPDSSLNEDPDFHIAEYMIYSDMWTISINPNNPNDYIIYNKAEDYIVLTNSFAEFLSKFLKGGVFEGLYDWRAEIAKRIKDNS